MGYRDRREESRRRALAPGSAWFAAALLTATAFLGLHREPLPTGAGGRETIRRLVASIGTPESSIDDERVRESLGRLGIRRLTIQDGLGQTKAELVASPGPAPERAIVERVPLGAMRDDVLSARLMARLAASTGTVLAPPMTGEVVIEHDAAPRPSWHRTFLAFGLLVLSAVLAAFGLLARSRERGEAAPPEVSAREQELFAVFERWPDGVVVIAADQTIRFLNRAAAGLLAAPRGVVGQEVRRAFPLLGRIQDQDDAEEGVVLRESADRVLMGRSLRWCSGITLLTLHEERFTAGLRRELLKIGAEAAVGQVVKEGSSQVDQLLSEALAELDPVQGGGAGDGGDPVRRRVVGELERAHDLVQAMSQISRMKGPERERVRVLDATRSVALLLDRKVGPGGGIVLDVPPHLHVIAHRARFHALLGCLLSGGGMRAGDPAVHVLARRCEGPDGCGDACEGLRLEVRMPRLVPLEPADRPVSLRQWVARGLAEELGGALEVIDEERRTLFRFHLPSGERTASPTSGRAHEGPTRVLIADDEEIIRNLLQEVCERAGVEVRLVTSGLGALEVLRQERFDYVILDLIMPGPMDGFETLRWIEKVAPDVKVIISSGRNPDRKMEDCIARAFAFVPKPFKVSDIVELIRPGHGREARAPAPALESGAPF